MNQTPIPDLPKDELAKLLAARITDEELRELTLSVIKNQILAIETTEERRAREAQCVRELKDRGRFEYYTREEEIKASKQYADKLAETEPVGARLVQHVQKAAKETLAEYFAQANVREAVRAALDVIKPRLPEIIAEAWIAWLKAAFSRNFFVDAIPNPAPIHPSLEQIAEAVREKILS